jgi:hypothetical protein
MKQLKSVQFNLQFLLLANPTPSRWYWGMWISFWRRLLVARLGDKRSYEKRWEAAALIGFPPMRHASFSAPPYGVDLWRRSMGFLTSSYADR